MHVSNKLIKLNGINYFGKKILMEEGYQRNSNATTQPDLAAKS